MMEWTPSMSKVILDEHGGANGAVGLLDVNSAKREACERLWSIFSSEDGTLHRDALEGLLCCGNIKLTEEELKHLDEAASTLRSAEDLYIELSKPGLRHMHKGRHFVLVTLVIQPILDIA